MIIQRTLMASALVSLLTITSVASAEGNPKNIGVAAKISTLGLGGEVSYNINDKFSVTAGLNGFSYDFDTEEQDISYDGSLNLGAFGVSGRYHPMSNGFFIGAGINSNNTEVTLDAKPSENGTFEFNNSTYSTSQVGSASAKLDFENKMAPHISLGWQSMQQGVSIFAELGVLFSGKPQLSYTVNCNENLTEKVCNQILDDVNAEKKKLEDDISDVSVLPIIATGIQYNF